MKKIAYLLLAAGPLCYLYKLPYLFRAWRTSPMDSWDFLALPAAAAAVFFAYRNTPVHLRRRPPVLLRFIPLAISIALFFAAQAASINSGAILAAAAVWWSCCFAALTPAFSLALLPALLLLFLGCTSSTYWIGYFFSLSTEAVVFLKALAAAVILILAALHIKLKAEATAYLLVFAGGVIAWYNSDTLSGGSWPLILDTGRRPENCVMRELPPDAAARRFFRNSLIRFHVFADESNEYHLLEIRDSGDIHDIHPASHCLRSGGREILSERIGVFQVREKLVPVSLIVTRHRGGSEIFAVWYSNFEHSCSGFLAFRRHWNRKRDWRIYQLSTRVNGSIEEAWTALERMVNSLARHSGSQEPRL